MANLVAQLAGLTTELASIDSRRLDQADVVNRAVLTELVAHARETLQNGLSEVGVSVRVAGAVARMVTTVPLASVADHTAAQAYLSRLAKLGRLLRRLARAASGSQGRRPVPDRAEELLAITAEQWRARLVDLFRCRATSGDRPHTSRNVRAIWASRDKT